MSSGELSLAHQKHGAFVDKLINDPTVREAYEKDPVGVLTSHGIGHDPANPPKPGSLAAPEQLGKTRDEAVKRMNAAGGLPAGSAGFFNPFTWGT